jgi:D-3-phosphoglycerate dehydrogenase
MAKVVVTDFTFDALDIETAILRPIGYDVIGLQCRTPAELIAAVADADCVVTQFAPITAEVIAAMRRAKAIVRYGVGVDNVDLDAARARGIPVCNVPDYCIDEVADHTLALILATTRRVCANDRHLRGGRWGLAVPLRAMTTLADLAVGVIGFGRIGRGVVRRLLAFGGRVLVCDPFVPVVDVDDQRCEAATLDALLAVSDVVTLHCPSTPDTRRMLDRARLARLKPGAIVVNVARGDLIETSALIDALTDGRVAAAALDVCDPEPIPPDSPLRALNNVIVTAHIASASIKAVRTLRETVADTAARTLRGEHPPHVVNGVTA